MRTVFTNRMCAHVWVQQTQAEGRSGSMRFTDNVMRSYAAPIAAIHKIRGKKKALLITSRHYSTTTSQHCSEVRSAWDHDLGTIHYVPDIGGLVTKPDHKRNKEYFQEQYNKTKLYLSKMQASSWGDWSAQYLLREAEKADAYCDAFGFAHLKLDVAGDTQTAYARILRLRSSPEYRSRKERIARERAAANARWEAQRIENARLVAENIPKWLNGEMTYLYNSDRVYLRASGEVVETSLGAQITLGEARALYLLMVRRLGGAWSAEQVGLVPMLSNSFTLRSVNGFGTLVVGCHTIHWPEIEDFARRMGWSA